MEIVFDPAKNARNLRERELPFERVVDFDFESATFLIDERREYGEIRHIAIGYLDGRLHFLCFTAIPGGIRVISFRKANLREAKQYGKTLTLD